jgi:hypothetical protein
VKYHLNWRNKSYAYAPRVDFPVDSYEIVPEKEEEPFEGHVDVLEYHKTQTKFGRAQGLVRTNTCMKGKHRSIIL